MPVSIRPKGKAKKIAENILGMERPKENKKKKSKY